MGQPCLVLDTAVALEMGQWELSLETTRIHGTTRAAWSRVTPANAWPHLHAMFIIDPQALPHATDVAVWAVIDALGGVFSFASGVVPKLAHAAEVLAQYLPPPPPLPSSASRRRFCLISHLYDWTFCSSLLFAAAGPGVAATALASASMSIVVAGSSVGHLSRIEQTLHPSVDAGEEADEDEAAPVADGLSTPICTNSFSMSHLGMPA